MRPKPPVEPRLKEKNIPVKMRMRPGIKWRTKVTGKTKKVKKHKKKR